MTRHGPGPPPLLGPTGSGPWWANDGNVSDASPRRMMLETGSSIFPTLWSVAMEASLLTYQAPHPLSTEIEWYDGPRVGVEPEEDLRLGDGL
jgi:hypothetical protein